MAQNRSSAVMAQRREPHDSLDDFPSPPWSGRALIEEVIAPHYWTWPDADKSTDGGLTSLARQSCWEPACNRGYLAEALRPYFGSLRASDIHDYGYASNHCPDDFLLRAAQGEVKYDWIITNPPFRLAEQFIQRSSEVAREGFAMLTRTSFLEGVGRYENLFSKNPPSIIAQFAERVPMHRGVVPEKGSTATAYCWLVWIGGEPDTRFTWIPPCRKRLERPGDYDKRG